MERSKKSEDFSYEWLGHGIALGMCHSPNAARATPVKKHRIPNAIKT
jgi:hypothetical protein